MAKRKVTFDGATINSPQAYWLAYILLSSDEKEAVGLLRMLNNSANQATEYLFKLGIEHSIATSKLKEVARLDKNQSRKALGDLPLKPENIDALLKFTHGFPPPSYFLIYNELVEKNLELSFVGKWNFAKVEAINNNIEALKNVPRATTGDYVEFLWNLVGGPLRYSGQLSQLMIQNNTVKFEKGITVNLKNLTCDITSEEFGRGIPKSMFYVKDNSIVEKKLANSNLTYSVILLKNKGRFSCVLLDGVLARSLLMRLYFFEGKGLRYFKPFIKEENLTKRTQIYIYEIDWNKFLKDTVSK